MANEAPPDWDREMRQRLLRGEASALCELYDGFAPLVHGLALRLLDDEEAAGRVVGEVFADIWEGSGAHESWKGSIRAWLVETTHHRAVRCLRERARATGGGRDGEVEERVRAAAATVRAEHIAAAMPAPLRTALDLAYARRCDYRGTAAALGVGEDEVQRRLRLGLHLLSTATTPPATGRDAGEPSGEAAGGAS